MASVTCKSCGKMTPDAALCIHCGKPLQPPITCPQCQRKLPGNQKKCQYCGADLVATKPPELVPCPKCGKKMAAHLSACLMCGAALPKGAPPSAVPARPAAASIETSAPSADIPIPGNATMKAMVWTLRGCTHNNEKRMDAALKCFDTALSI